MKVSMTDNDQSVLDFRAQRLRRAPRNWTYWVAGFTAVNGLFLVMQQDFMILAGLVAPFAMPGAAPHLVAAGLFAAMAYLSTRLPKILIIAVIIYIADAIFAASAQLWAGVVMHAVVLGIVGFTFVGLRAVKALQAQQSGRAA